MRHTLYGALSPARQLRLHRDLAETMAAVYGERAPEHAGEIARHWRRSAPLAGAERGVAYCLAAADQAQDAVTLGEVAVQLRAAFDLLPAGSVERPRLLSRLALALVWALEFDEAPVVACEAARLIAAAEGHQAAANYLISAVSAMLEAGYFAGAMTLAAGGVSYTGGRHDFTWAVLMDMENIRRQASDPNNPGMLLDSPERGEISRAFVEHGVLDTWVTPWAGSREDLVARVGDSPLHMTRGGGELRRALDRWEEAAAKALRQGQIANAVGCSAHLARCHNALGNFDEAAVAYERGSALADRLPGPSIRRSVLAGATHERRLALDVGWEASLEEFAERRGWQPELFWCFAAFQSFAAVGMARLGRADDAMNFLAATVPAVEQAPAWAPTYPGVTCSAIEVLWLLERREYVEVLERNLRQKVLQPDFRFPMQDARVALARLCALQGRYDEACDWFARGRAVLDEQGARPLRAILDYDEALMYVRRDAPGDRSRARPFLDAALAQFRTLCMTGWIRRAEALLKRCAVGGARAEEHSQ